MTFAFRPAIRENEPIRLGLAGPSRSGKSESSVRVGRGMVGGDNGKIFAINTEPGGISLYADSYPGFMIGDLKPPFSPARYREAMEAAVKAGAGVIIVDSMSHEHAGEGGILDMQEAELKRMAGDDWAKRERMKFTAWIKPKAEHDAFVQFVLRLPIPTIFCFRAKEKLKLVRGTDGKINPVPQGYQPIITDSFEYELHSLISLGENAKGVPDLDAQATGLRQPVDKLLAAARGTPLDEGFGRELAAWARGGAAKPKAEVKPSPFIWVSSDGRTQDYGTIEEWTARLFRMIEKAPEAKALKDGFIRNAGVLTELRTLGHGEAVTRVETGAVQRGEQLAGQPS